jgi:hypothetical protein
VPSLSTAPDGLRSVGCPGTGAVPALEEGPSPPSLQLATFPRGDASSP